MDETRDQGLQNGESEVDAKLRELHEHQKAEQSKAYDNGHEEGLTQERARLFRGLLNWMGQLDTALMQELGGEMFRPDAQLDNDELNKAIKATLDRTFDDYTITQKLEELEEYARETRNSAESAESHAEDLRNLIPDLDDLRCDLVTDLEASPVIKNEKDWR